MGRNRTSLMRSTSVSARPELTGTLVRLMLSVNDIALAADANDQWAETGEGLLIVEEVLGRRS